MEVASSRNAVTDRGGFVQRTSGGVVLVIVGLYQLTTWKSKCLRHCRSAFGFLDNELRDGTGGAFGMEWRHGIYCLGCCWALMCILFVVGVMNLLWIAALSVLVLVEKSGRAGALAARFRSRSCARRCFALILNWATF